MRCTDGGRTLSLFRSRQSRQRGRSLGVGLLLGLVLGLGLAAAVVLLPKGMTAEELWSRVQGLPVIPPEGDVTPRAPDAVEPAPAPPKPSPGAKGSRTTTARAADSAGPDRSLARRTPCSISSGEMNQTRDDHAAALLRCFQPEFRNLPREVGLASKWEVAIDGHGRVRRVTPHLFALDYKRTEEEQRKTPYAAPGKDSPAVRCASREVASWNFSKFITNPLHLDLMMECDLSVTLREPQ